jgi:hypothetical protein
VRSWNLGVREVSGLGLRRDPGSGTSELVAVSDRSRSVVRLPVDGTGRLPDGRHAARQQRVHRLPADLDRPGAGSQWEGVAGDGAGRLVILCERTSELLVVGADFRFERRIALRHEWLDDGRAGLEAVLPLRRGHVLAAKQRDPLRLIEFGPAGDAPLGMNAEALPAAGEPLSLTSAAELRSLASWRFAGDRPDSVNDLAADSGRLYLISSADRGIARIRLPAADPLRIDGWWPLPRGVGAGGDARAEGLLVDAGLGVLVGVDAHADGPNLHRIGARWPSAES